MVQEKTIIHMILSLALRNNKFSIYFYDE
jgi:hypothetical protein